MHGERLRMARKASGMTLQEVADRMNTSHTTILRYEQEKRDIPTETMRKLCDLYNVHADWVIGTKFG